MAENYPIDVVILWVDGSDPEWLKEKAKYSGKDESINSNCEARFRDWDNLQYLFRGIEKYWPWVNRVFLVTNGQCPKWLDTGCGKLRFVTHREFMPAEHLPTFNSNAIELNLHRIKDLSEHFILLNDDMFPVRPMKRTDFFKDGLPCDSGQMMTSYSIRSEKGFNIEIMDFFNIGLVNFHFRKKRVCKEKPMNWYGPYLGLRGILRNLFKIGQRFFVGFENRHSAQSFLKSTLCEVWEKEYEYLWRTSGSRFRSDLNVTQYLIRYWQLASNRFYPTNLQNRMWFDLCDNTVDTICSCLRSQKADIICLNDTEMSVFGDVDRVKQKVNSAFESILPEKSSFEI